MGARTRPRRGGVSWAAILVRATPNPADPGHIPAPDRLIREHQLIPVMDIRRTPEGTRIPAVRITPAHRIHAGVIPVAGIPAGAATEAGVLRA